MKEAEFMGVAGAEMNQVGADGGLNLWGLRGFN